MNTQFRLCSQGNAAIIGICELLRRGHGIVSSRDGITKFTSKSIRVLFVLVLIRCARNSNSFVLSFNYAMRVQYNIDNALRDMHRLYLPCICRSVEETKEIIILITIATPRIVRARRVHTRTFTVDSTKIYIFTSDYISSF